MASAKVQRWLDTPLSKCPKCKDPIYLTNPRVSYKDKLYHEKCVPKAARAKARRYREASRNDW